MKVVFNLLLALSLSISIGYANVIGKVGHTNPGKLKVQSGMNLVGIVKDADTKKPLPGIIVSDGYSVVQTDKKGIYQLRRDSNARFVYYSIPAKAKVLTKSGSPNFYEKIDTGVKVFRKDFELEILENGPEENFMLYALADPQVRTNAHLGRFKNESMVDLEKNIKNTLPAYGLVLGDLVSDNLALLEPIKDAMELHSIKMFSVIGNHDHDQDKKNDLEAAKPFEDAFGPTNYSFNRGNVHIIVMDNVIYNAKQTYVAGFTEKQVKWLEEDLKYVSKDKLIILSVHIPLYARLRKLSSVIKVNEVRELLDPYKEVHIMSGHTHYNENVRVSDNIYEHIHGAVCGAWWTGTINSDGTPNGYGVYSIKDNTIINWHYKSVNYNQNYQVRMYPPYSFGDHTGYVKANIWNSDEEWKVEFYEDEKKTGEMTNERDYDKGAYAFFKSLGKPEPVTPNEAPRWFRRPQTIYHFKPKNLGAKFMIRAIDKFGNVYEQNQMVSEITKFLNY